MKQFGIGTLIAGLALAAVLLLRAEIACARQDQAEATALATQLRDALRQAPIERPDLVERLNALAPCIQK